MTALAPLLEAFFTERLIGQRDASQHTVASYRDAFCLLLRFAHRRTGKAPHQLTIEDLDASLVGAFLNHLEDERNVSVRTRNVRLTAIRSLFHFAAYRHPEHAGLIQRVLAIPPKRTNKALVTYLTDEEMAALLQAPDRRSWIGRRDQALLVLALETGMRVSELTGLTRDAVRLGTGAHVRCHGKGRKARDHPAAPRSPSGDRGLARRTRRGTRRSAVPRTKRRATQPRRRPSARRAPHRRRRPHLSVACNQEGDPPRPAPQLRNEPPSSRGRPGDHRVDPRPRRRPHHLQRVPPRRPQTEREGARAHSATQDACRSIPAARPSPRLLGKPVTMRCRPRSQPS